MADRPTTIAEMLERTVAQRGDEPAIGFIKENQIAVNWSWRLVSQFVDRCVAASDDHHQPKGAVTTPLIFERRDSPLDWLGANLAASRARKTFVPVSFPPTACPVSPAIASLVQTSGTSGLPRWVALSHENLVSNTIAVADTIAASLDEDDRDEVRLSFLPFHHLYARVCDLYCWVYRGSRVVLTESRDTIFRDCRIARPTTINGVPYFFQKAVDLADRERISLRQLLGGEIRRCYSGGAALSAELQTRFFDEGIPLLNGYGLSEASPVVTVSTVKDYKIGTVGKPLPGVELRIADDGEVLVRGPNVMLGYGDAQGQIDQPATAEVIRGGWLHTGDLGQLDTDGFLSITGRKKEQIVLSTGKNVSPSRVEALLAASPWIEQVAVVGDGQSCLAALVVPNPDRVRAEVRRRRLWVWSKRRALTHPVIREVFAREIADRLTDASSEEQVRAFRLIPRAFSPQRGEITAKLSLRRQRIQQSFQREIRWLFGPGKQSPGSPAAARTEA